MSCRQYKYEYERLSHKNTKKKNWRYMIDCEIRLIVFNSYRKRKDEEKEKVDPEKEHYL